MKIIGFTCLHYGTDYLGWAIRSVIDHVDEHHVIYSPVGSHGHSTDRKCPDTRDELYAIAKRAAGSKLVWTEGRFPHEGAHRSHIHTVAPNADYILVVDSDEVYADGLAQEAIEFAQHVEVHAVRLPFIHLWRSFKRGFAHDPAYPHRVINPRIAEGEVTMSTEKRVWHFGYAQRADVVAYKIETHGHRNEWKAHWLTDVFLANRQYDCHPVGSDAWNCDDIDLSGLPSVLQNHPYRNLDIIP